MTPRSPKLRELRLVKLVITIEAEFPLSASKGTEEVMECINQAEKILREQGNVTDIQRRFVGELRHEQEGAAENKS